ncbi:MAG: cyclopropane-fatty-acyl-phospholipid synthase family protein [Pseudomonadota bacterium]
MIRSFGRSALRFVDSSSLVDRFVQYFSKENIPIRIIDTSGKTYEAGNRSKYTLHIRDNRFLKSLVSPDAFSLGDAYIKGYFDLSGNIIELYELVCNKLLNTDRKKSLSAYFSGLFSNPLKQEAKNIQYHYDVPPEFYELFLGETMGYTCGYYADDNRTMDQAQYDKMDIICRKLRLQPGDRMLDIGCGWGGLLVHAAANYGVDATGITLSTQQKSYADQSILSRGLADRCRVLLLNYRNLAGTLYNKIACVGMSEHVGEKNMTGFFKTVYSCLSPGGLFLQHTITTNTRRKPGYENSFLDRYMFPGGQLLFQHKLIEHAEATQFELLQAENFRVHYVKTLKDWIDRMERNRDRILSLVPEMVYRIYHIFFVGSLVSFNTQEISLVQNLFYKKEDNQDIGQYFSTRFADA